MLSSIRLLIWDAAWFNSIITIEKLNTVSEIMPPEMDVSIERAVLASRKLNQLSLDLRCFPVSEKSNSSIRMDNSKKPNDIRAG
jgi:hypothetical protein